MTDRDVSTAVRPDVRWDSPVCAGAAHVVILRAQQYAQAIANKDTVGCSHCHGLDHTGDACLCSCEQEHQPREEDARQLLLHAVTRLAEENLKAHREQVSR